MEKVYVIGSLNQCDEIKEYANAIPKVFKSVKEVNYVKKEINKTFEQLVSECFDMIEKSDTIFVVMKKDLSIGKGVTYEVEYAKRLNKEIIYV